MDRPAQILETPGISVDMTAPSVYLLRVDGHLTRRHIEHSLDAIWSSPGWRQPWGLVVNLEAGVTYDADIRATPVPARGRRAVGTAVITPSSMQRMVLSTIALALRMSSKFQLSAHEAPSDATEHMVAVLARARAEHRRY